MRRGIRKMKGAGGKQEGPDGQLVHAGPTFAQLEEEAVMEAEQEEASMVHQFERNLRWNLGLVGSSPPPLPPLPRRPSHPHKNQHSQGQGPGRQEGAHS